MLDCIQDVGPERPLKHCRNPPSEQDPVGGQQDHSLADPWESPELREEEDKHDKGKHSIEQLVILNQTLHLHWVHRCFHYLAGCGDYYLS